MKIIYITASILLVSSPAYAMSVQLEGCSQQRVAISQQIQAAAGDENRVSALVRELQEVNANCKDDADTQKKNRLIIDALGRYNRAAAELRKAQVEADSPEKISKLQREVEDARRELDARQP
jgi:tRNA uridine 5-carbamoylmethylation protein Kti12